MEQVVIHIEAEINPTESENKVKTAVENVFSNVMASVQPAHKGAMLIAEGSGQEALTKLYNMLRRERIRDAARKALFEGLDRNAISFCLNKQVAFAGHISFCKEVAESPLGPIKVRIESADPRKLIDWLTSKDT